MGTGLALLVRDRKTESGDMEVGPRDLGMGDGWLSALTQDSRGNWAQQHPPPMCPTNQVTSISEVLFLGGGSDKMSYPLSGLVSPMCVEAVFSSQ